MNKIEKSDRDSKGRFLPGHNPFNTKKQNELRDAWYNCFTPELWRKIHKRHIEIIMESKGRTAVAALELLYDRFYGKVKQAIDLDVTSRHTLADSVFDPSRLSTDELKQVVQILDNAFPPVLTDATSVREIVPVEPIEKVPENKGDSTK
jgi:truncated hemoglobin YjbI